MCPCSHIGTYTVSGFVIEFKLGKKSGCVCLRERETDIDSTSEQ